MSQNFGHTIIILSLYRDVVSGNTICSVGSHQTSEDVRYPLCFPCGDDCVPFTKLIDGTNDCTDGEDETTLAALLVTPTFSTQRRQEFTYPCPRNSSLCSPFTEECYPNDRFCVSERNWMGDPLYCSDNGNLRTCVQYVCPGSYKCNQSYCIPVHSVCDGVEDCPYGEDEVNCDNYSCQRTLICKGDCTTKICLIHMYIDIASTSLWKHGNIFFYVFLLFFYFHEV